MTTAQPSRKPWYLTKSQWAEQQASQAHWAAVAEQQRAAAARRPPQAQVPPGILPVVWARMTEVERAQAWQAHRQHEESMASQARTRTLLVTIFVGIPVAVLLVVLVFVAVGHMG
jgi:hypothetical protein